MKSEQAEKIAVDALFWLSGEEEEMAAFLGASGAAPEDLRTRAAEPDFLCFVLEFLMSDDGRVMAFCDARGLPYETPMQALASLPGGAQTHWT